MASIDIHRVRKTFGSIAVLHGIDLSIADGEFVVLVGPSGCGKSTLLRMIAGLESVSDGDIRIAGDVVNDLAPKDRDIAMVFQSYALYPHMTVERNMGYGLKLRRTPAEVAGAAVRRAASKLGLGALMDRKPRTLSGGQRQRVAMGRAIVRKPKAFLFDEPLSNLDARLREQMRTEIKRLHRDLGTTSVYVTHDQVEAMTLADRIVAMDGGRIQQVGTPLDLYERPANLFVAGFIGSPAMNVLEGRFRRRDAATWVELPGGLSVAVANRPRLDDVDPVTVGLRPEDMGVASASGDGPGAATGVVELVEPMGLGVVVHVRLGDASIKAFTMDRRLPPPGSPIALRPDPAKIHLFDGRTGARL